MSLVAEKVDVQAFLEPLGIKAVNLGVSTGLEWIDGEGDIISSYSPVDGQLIGKVKTATRQDYDAVMDKAQEAFKTWRMIPAPQRGEIVRQIRDELRV